MSSAADPAGAAAAAAAATATPSGRAPRLPRWTRQEILVLIEGKRVVEGRGGRGARGRVAAAALAAAGGAGAGEAAAALEPKWAAVAEYCRRHGLERGPVQCRKRWSNLAGDYKKIKEWERAAAAAREPSFWAMRNDARRERRLPGFFDREVYDILDGRGRGLLAGGSGGNAAEEEEAPRAEEEEEQAAGREMEVRVEETVFDSGRPAGEESLFSEDDEEEEEDVPAADAPAQAPPPPAAAAVIALPISGKPQASTQQRAEQEPQGTSKDKQPEQQGTERGSSQQQGGQKRRRTDEGIDDDSHGSSRDLQSKLVELLDRNSRMVAAQLEAQNINSELDRAQRKEQMDGLALVLGRLADALGRIADKI